MPTGGLAAALLAVSTLGSPGAEPLRPRPARRPAMSWDQRLGKPQNVVLVTLAALIAFGGGRKLLQSWRARQAVARLEGDRARVADIEAAAEHGRAALTELFRLQATAREETLRDAAGRALAVLWARDELIAEEEKAVVRRGFQVAWSARKRYPRALRLPVSIAVHYGVPFLVAEGEGVKRSNLAWSHKIEGARKASLESFSAPKTGEGRAEFAIVPTDFDAGGPHRLVLQARVSTIGLTESWDLDLPHMSFSFEFDPALSLDALLALPDATRRGQFAAAVRLIDRRHLDGEEPTFLTLNEDWALRDVPHLEVRTPLPCDLAHRLEIEIDGIEGWHAGHPVVVTGQGTAVLGASETLQFAIGPFDRPLPAALSRPGTCRLRARLVASPELGWAVADVRSLWPGTIETDWVEVGLVRS